MLILVTSFTVAHSITLGLATLQVVEPLAGPIEALIALSIVLVGAENVWLLGGKQLWFPASLLVLGVVLMLCGQLAFPIGGHVGLSMFFVCHFLVLGLSKDTSLARAVVSFAFGLIHGFGFAGVLATLDLAPTRLAPALLGFNLGIEIGQLVLVAVCWPVLRAVRRGDDVAARLVAEVTSAAICGAGVFWLLVRLQTP